MTPFAPKIKDIRIRTTQKILQPECVTTSVHPTEQQQYEMNFDVSSALHLRTTLQQENKTSLSDLINS